jgi:1-acyl-sn-glycerol-3-phosphate acyltransferase
MPPTSRRHPRLRRRLERAAQDPDRNDPPRYRREPFDVRLIGRVFQLSGPLLADLRVYGTEHIPEDGPLVVAGNHVSDIDPFILGRVLIRHGRYAHFLAKEEVFRVPVLRNVLSGGQQLEVRRGTPAAGTVLEDASVLLARGEAVALYPEGKETLSPDYWPIQGRLGAACLALASGAPVLPVAIWGSQDVRGHQHSLRLIPRQTITVAFGQPLRMDDFLGRPWTDENLQEATDEILGAILALLRPLRKDEPPAEVTTGRPGWDPDEAERRARESTGL